MLAVLLFLLSVLLVDTASAFGGCSDDDYLRCSDMGFGSAYHTSECRYKSLGDVFCSGGVWYRCIDRGKDFYSRYCSQVVKRCSSCDPLDNPDYVPDTTYHCQNSGGASSGGIGGAPSVALIFRQIDGGVAELTSSLNGTCQDWGFCPDGVNDCDIDKDSTGKSPCRRSGERFIAGSRCYYQCPDGSSVSCKPTSTQYVAGAIYAGECPDTPPESCLDLKTPPPADDSTGSGSGGGGGGGGGGGTSPDDWRDTLPDGSGTPDYMPILTAIHDTLSRANKQRRALSELVDGISFDVSTIADNAPGSRIAAENINKNFSSYASQDISLTSDIREGLDSSRLLLAEIKDFLSADSLYYGAVHDTGFYPLLRDIAGGIDSVNTSIDTLHVVNRDSAFARWFADYVSDSARSGTALGQLVDGFGDVFGDSTQRVNCAPFLSCLRSASLDSCASVYGVSMVGQCAEGGSPLDGMLNVSLNILETIKDAIWGDDDTPLSSSADTSIDSKYSDAVAALSSASSLVDTSGISSYIDSLRSLVDSLERVKNDSVSVQPDSLWLDSSDAAGYVDNILLPGGTASDCFVCSADLGDFGGLSDSSYTIYIDFGDFGGFDWCAIIRAVVRIATLVVCISLTLGSWAAAFGYNPKNDA